MKSFGITDLACDSYILSGDSYFKPAGVACVNSKFRPNGDKIWRHFALQFDETCDMLRLFMDGTLVFEMNLEVKVSELDCVGDGKRWSLGHSHPG